MFCIKFHQKQKKTKIWSPKIYYKVTAYILPLMISVYLRSNFYGGLRKTILFLRGGVSAVQGHPWSLTLAPIESAYATSY